MAEEKERIAWHPAFREAMRVELEDYQDVIEFHEEFPLTTESLKMDLLIIKKRRDVVIKKNIGRIFMEHNVLELKSPDDTVTIESFWKVCAYAFLYASLQSIRKNSVTLTFIHMRQPRTQKR